MNDHTSSAARYRLSHQSFLRDDLVKLCPYEPGLDSKVASDADGMDLEVMGREISDTRLELRNGQSIAHD